MAVARARIETIMVVEDDHHLAELVATALESDGFHVETAQDGQDALDKVERHPPDVIILDLGLPRVSGLQVVKRCRENPATRRVPIIIASASHAHLFERDLESLVYMEKPFSIDVLRVLVEDAVSPRRPQ